MLVHGLVPAGSERGPAGSEGGAVTEERRSYCRICAAACGILVTVEGDQVVGVRGDPDHPGSAGYTCPKGRALGLFHHAPNRLDQPRVHGVEHAWDDALDDLGADLTSVRDEHGRDAIGFYLATGFGYDSAAQVASMTWFGAQRSRSLYTAATVDNSPVLVAAELVTGLPFLNPVWDPTQPGLLVVFGSNPAVSHGYGTSMPDPITHLRRYRAAGGEVWVVDPRRTETAAHADHHLAARPGSDTAILAFLCRGLLEAGADPIEVAERCNPDDIAVLRDVLEPFTIDRAAGASGLSADELEGLLAAVRAHVGRLAVMCGTGLTMSRDGVLAEWLRWVLLALSGSLDREGGMRFNQGTVSRPVRPPTGPAKVRPGPPSRPDLRTVIGQFPCVAMVDEIEAGNLRALVIGGGNPLTAFPDVDRTRAALASLDVLAVVDVVESELTDLATHVLPATGQLERSDLTLAEGTSWRSALQHTAAVVPPGGDRKAAWWIFAQLGRRTGADLLSGVDPDLITDDLFLGGVLGHAGLDVDEVHAQGPHGIEVEHRYGWVADELLPEGRWRLAPAELVERLGTIGAASLPQGSDATRDRGEGVLLLTNRRDIRRLNSLDYAGEPTGRADGPQARLHPDDAATNGVAEAASIRITSAHGSIEATARLDVGVLPGTISVNHGRADGANVAALTSTIVDVDPITGMPHASGLPVTITPG